MACAFQVAVLSICALEEPGSSEGRLERRQARKKAGSSEGRLERKDWAMKKTPLQEVKERFGSKQNLVKELKGLFDKGKLFEDRLNPDKGLDHVSNAKLLKLHRVATEVTERFTTRENLVNDLVKLMKRENDEGLKDRFEKWGLPRLYDYYQSVATRKN